MRDSSKAALGGIISALAVIIMLMTYLSPLLVYTAPPVAGLLLIIMVNEIGYKWAFGTYVSVSLLSVFLIADKESAVFFTMLFGYYPMLKLFLDSKIKNGILRRLIKFSVFNIAVISAVFICMFVFNIDYDDFSETGMGFLVSFVVLFNVLLALYDVVISKMNRLYLLKFSGSLKKMFRR